MAKIIDAKIVGVHITTNNDNAAKLILDLSSSDERCPEKISLNITPEEVKSFFDFIYDYIGYWTSGPYHFGRSWVGNVCFYDGDNKIHYLLSKDCSIELPKLIKKILDHPKMQEPIKKLLNEPKIQKNDTDPMVGAKKRTDDNLRSVFG